MRAQILRFIYPAVIFFILVFSEIAGRAQPRKEDEVPPGMEFIKVGNNEILIPKGTKVTKKDAQLILEPPEQFWSRRIEGIEEEIAKLKDGEREIKKDIAELKQSVSQNPNVPKK